jgi:hypothetical protein
MEVLYYNDLDFSKVKKQFEKTVNQLKTTPLSILV